MTGAIISSLHPRLLRAYRATRYEACGIAVRIGRRSAAMDAVLRGLGSRCGGLITAWNPASRRLPDGVNRRRQRRLAECLRRTRCVGAQGHLRHWREEKLLAAADPRLLAVVGRRFGQSAIVVLQVNRPARLVPLIACRAVLHQFGEALRKWHPLASVRPAPTAARGRPERRRVAGSQS